MREYPYPSIIYTSELDDVWDNDEIRLNRNTIKQNQRHSKYNLKTWFIVSVNARVTNAVVAYLTANV